MITLVPDPHLLPLPAALVELAKSPSLLLYVGPDQVMPLMSMLGAIVGMALMFWNKLLGLVRRSKTLFSRRSRAPHPETAD
jgi:hypothetical protein